VITQCCIHELYLQREQQTAVDLAKAFERRKCNHREPIPGDDCLASVVGDSNKHRYVIATQSNPLRTKLRTIPAVPIVHINRTVMILEPPSDVTMRAKLLMEQKALDTTSSTEKALLASTSTEPTPKKKRGPKGPNPLSVMKKKKPSNPPNLPAKTHDTSREKGKGKSTGTVKDGETGEKHAERSAVTGKRKRSEEDESSTKGQRSADPEDTDVVANASGTSRKRRRKRKASDSLSTPT